MNDYCSTTPARKEERLLKSMQTPWITRRQERLFVKPTEKGGEKLVFKNIAYFVESKE